MRSWIAAQLETGRPPGMRGRPGSPGCRFPFAGAASRGFRDRPDPIRERKLIPEDKVWKSSAAHLWTAAKASTASRVCVERRFRFGNARMNSDVGERSFRCLSTVANVNQSPHSPSRLTRRSIIGLSDFIFGGAGGSIANGGPCCGLGRDGAARYWLLRSSVGCGALIDRESVVRGGGADGSR